jgi:hypothetical protein
MMTDPKLLLLSTSERAALDAIAATSTGMIDTPRPIHYALEERGFLELHVLDDPPRPKWTAQSATPPRWSAAITKRGHEALGTREPLVIYHGPDCTDGFTAAWAAWRAFNGNVELVPASYGDPPPDDVAGRDVYVLDFSYSRAELEALAARARSLLVLDHHRTAQAALEGLPFARFDLSRSGAALAWDHFFGGPATGRPRPWLVEYVQDRDLWSWQLPQSREVSAYLRSLEMTLAEWNSLAARDRVREVAPLGAAILRYQEQLVRSAVTRAGAARLPGVDLEVPCVNATELISEIGNELSRAAPFAIVWNVSADGSVYYSLSSSASNAKHADVSAIARELGGGGHRHAAGFHAPRAVHEVQLIAGELGPAPARAAG